MARIDLTNYTKETEVFDRAKKEITPIIRQALREKFFDDDEFPEQATYNDIKDGVVIAYDVTNKNGEVVDGFITVEVHTHKYNSVERKDGSVISSFDRQKVEDLKFDYEQYLEKEKERAEKARIKAEKEDREKQAREQARNKAE